MNYDVFFQDANDSMNMGFQMSIQECKDWIDNNKNDKTTYFGDFESGVVQIVSNDGEVVYQEPISM